MTDLSRVDNDWLARLNSDRTSYIKMARRRINVSIPKEDRIWDLRCQGYDYDTIARITNVSVSTPGRVIRRVIRRPPVELDPLKRGRKAGFLSDRQIENIRSRFRSGETQFSIASDYEIGVSSIHRICHHKTYAEPCNDQTSQGYKFCFRNRLVQG